MINRRKFLRSTAATGLMLAAPGLAAPAIAQGRKIKLGYVSPQTGPLAGFAESDNYNIEAFLASSVGKNFEVIVKDSQSNPNRAADVAKELILSDEVNLMLVASTPETTNPVSGVCESEGIPVLSTVAPWQPWFIGQQANPRDPSSWQPFEFAFHYFWGMEDVIAVYTAMWDQLQTDKSVGGLFPNDADGNAWGDPKLGFPPVLAKQGFELLDPGRYQNLTDDFSAQIAAFKGADVEIVTGVMIPPDFTTFWTQARQQGFVPKIASMGKAILFPVAVEALGQQGNNLSSEVWWSPNHPFSSSLTGQSSMQLAQAYTESTGKQWTQPIGFAHALFEVAIDVLKRSADPKDVEANLAAIASTNLNTIVGPVAWGNGPVKNVAKTPLVGGQWRLSDGGKFPYELLVVNNETAPNIPAQGELQPIT